MLSIIRDFRRFVSVCFIVFRHPGWDIHRLRVALALYKTRKALCDLEDWQLRDIGLTCEDVMRECNRPLLADDAPWLSGKHKLHGDVYLHGRPAHKIRSFYQVRDACRPKNQ